MSVVYGQCFTKRTNTFDKNVEFSKCNLHGSSYHRTKQWFDSYENCHSTSMKQVELLKDLNIEDGKFFRIINDINFEISQRYKKPQQKPTVSSPIFKTLKGTIALDLKQSSWNAWFLQMIHYLTRFSASCVTKSKHKEIIFKSIFQIWILTFALPLYNHLIV